MAKLLLILLVGLLFESAGVVLLKKGMNNIGEVKIVSAPELIRVAKAGLTSTQIWLGVCFEAVFFGCLIILMNKSEISFLWPLTGLSFVFATFAAIWFLDEHVSVIRWVGVALIMIGAVFISYSERAKPLETATRATSPTAAR
jgi:multidrug transporter EmrE-like cation transporter